MACLVTPVSKIAVLARKVHKNSVESALLVVPEIFHYFILLSAYSVLLMFEVVLKNESNC